MKKYLVNIRRIYAFGLLGLIMSISSLYFCIYPSSLLIRLDNLTHDVFFRINEYFNNDIKGDERIVIVDIDEKSLAKIGQWPWDRDLLACLLEKLNKSSVIGLDIYFAEHDKRGQITKGMDDNDFLKLNIPKYSFCKRHKDTDKVFAESLANTPSVLAYAVNLGSYINQTEKKLAPLSNQSILEERLSYEFLEHGKNITASIEELSDNSYANGFVNSSTYLDNVIRSAFMFIYYDDGQMEQLLPSLSLAMYAKYKNIEEIKAIGTENGIDVIVGDEIIKADAHALLGLYFKGKTPHYKYISAIDVLDGSISSSFFKDKIVLIGTSSIGLNDIRTNPLDENIPGVEIHAFVIDNLLHKEYVIRAYNYTEIACFEVLAAIFLSILFMQSRSVFSQMFWHLFMMSSICVLHYQLFIYYRFVLDTFSMMLAFIVTMIIGLIINFFLESKQKELIKSKLEKKVSKTVADQLINTKSDVFDINKKEISVFFSDIRDFTSISERMQLDELIGLLNEYMSHMSDIIFKNNGTVDKFIGDAVMAYFNAPNDVKNHADAALCSAIEQIKALKELNAKWKAKDYPYINIGIGINTAECIVGEMGSNTRSDYTCIGDGVNIASRIEGVCKDYKVNILFSEATFLALKDPNKYEIELVDEILLKGKEKAIKIYVCYGYKNEKLNLWENI